jgi:uncharacterized integral membrane protein (TIGR00697 family)
LGEHKGKKISEYESIQDAEIPVGSVVQVRRERVFLVLAGLFLGSMTMLNILGVTRFLDLSFEAFGVKFSLPLAVGVLPYPLTFLCTDLISEIYGRKRANFLVWVGFFVNIWLMFILWLGGVLPGFPGPGGEEPIFFEVRRMALGGILGSMVAYLAAQLIDVHLFHFWKKLTHGRHLWLRNNGSTIVSQFIDTFLIISITHFYLHALPIEADLPLWPQLRVFIFTGYLFKLLAALLDTIPFYWGTAWLRSYLKVGEPESSAP